MKYSLIWMMSVLWLVAECEPPPPSASYVTTVEDGSFVPPPAPIDVSEARSLDSRPRGSSRYRISKGDSAAFPARPSQSSQYTPPPSDSYSGPIAIASAPSSRYGPPSTGYGPPIAIGTRPSSVYGPPSASRRTSSTSSYSPIAVYSGSQKSSSSSGYNERSEPVNYEFQYSVLDVQTGADFGHQESRMGDAAWGAYYVLLPDGRRQVVEYEADQHGYRPKVRYEDARSASGSHGQGHGSHSHGNHGHSGGPY